MSSGYLWLPREGDVKHWANAKQNHLVTFWMCTLLSFVFWLPPVASALGLDRWIAVPLVAAYGVRALLTVPLLPWIERRQGGRYVVLVEIAQGLATVAGLALATHDPSTSLWALAVMYATFEGSDHEFPPVYLYLALHMLVPLATIPLFVATGVPLGKAVGGPAFVSVMTGIAYVYTANRKRAVRADFERRDQLQGDLLRAHHATEHERVSDRLVSGIASRLQDAGREGSERITEAVREGLVELRSMLGSLSEKPAPPVAAPPPAAPSPSKTYGWLPVSLSTDAWNWSPRTMLTTAAITTPLALVLGTPAVARALGVDSRVMLAAIVPWIAWCLIHASICGWTSATPRRRGGAMLVNLFLAVAITCALAVASHTPNTALWSGLVMYAAFNGTEYEILPSFTALGAFVLGPIMTIPIFIAMGAATKPAVALPLLFAVINVVAYHYTSVRSRVVRDARRELQRVEIELHELRAIRDRERLARDLHDGVGASLSLAAVYSDLLRTATDDATRARLREALDLATRQSLEDLSDVLAGLAPGEDRIGDLARLLAKRTTPLASAASVDLEVRTASVDDSVDVSTRYAIVRIVQEATSNALRHGRPRRIVVELSRAPDAIRLAITDDGRGFDAGRDHDGRGLVNMRRRATDLGGTLEIRSSATGTAIDASFPAPSLSARATA